jgi:hypothetical protein
MEQSTLLLYADTLKPNTTPQSVHEVRFKRPVHLQYFRIVCDGECPHSELNFSGETPSLQLTIELFGCEHGSEPICTALLPAPFLRSEMVGPSQMQALSAAAASARCTYLVIR